MKSTQVLPAFIAVALSLGLVSGASAARPKPVGCGDTITTSTRLDHDLVDCPDNGIVIGADGITLDLDGHTIDGDDALDEDCAPDEDCDIGVVNTAGHRGVTIKGGAIREFGLAAVVAGGDDNRLRDLEVTANEFAGLVVVDAGGAEISRNAVTRNALDTNGTGVVLFGAHDSRIVRNVVSANHDGIFAGDSQRILIAENEVDDQAQGIGTDRIEDSEITRNRAVGDAGAVILVGDRNIVSRNYVADSVHCGNDECGQGISFEGGTGNVIERNLVERTVEAGIRLAAFEPDTPPAVANTVRRNVVRGSLTDGILVEETATDTLLERNVAVASADDGIDVENPATALTRNVANRNGDLGIEAVAGVIDGGRNRASGNGDPAQCTNVSCG